MMENFFDVAGIGNALVDILVHAEDETLARLGLVKGSMQLVDMAQAENIYNQIGPGVEISGGSGANTMAGIASLGGNAAYIGKVANDQWGRVFAHDIKAAGVHFTTHPLQAEDQLATGRCIVIITPDAQRTMCTYLGGSNALTVDDIDAEVIGKSAVCYLEGYLFDPPLAKKAFYKAAKIAREAGRKVALSLSDMFCIDRHRDDFIKLIDEQVDIVFANENEILSLYQTDDMNEAVRHIRYHAELACLTRSEAGSLIVTKDEVIVVEAGKVDRVVDTTGAGDLYAAGFLYGYTRQMPLAKCGEIASISAAEIISHTGARPETPLKNLLAA